MRIKGGRVGEEVGIKVNEVRCHADGSLYVHVLSSKMLLISFSDEGM